MKRLSLAFLFSLVLSLSLAFTALADDPIPGEIRLWPTANPPAGWLICDGSTLDVADYPELHQTILWIYGGYTGEEDQFKLPDLRGRVPVGLDASQTQFDGYGETGGEINHTLTVAEMPSHTHVQDQHTHVQNPHSHTLDGGLNGVLGSTIRGMIAVNNGSNNTVSRDTTATNQYTTATNQYTGGGAAHNNLQPYLTMNYIIYAGGISAPTPTPTATPGPTVTPSATSTGTLYMPYLSAYTTTLTSGKTLVQPVQVSFGQVIISGLVLAIVTVVALQLLYGVVFKR